MRGLSAPDFSTSIPRRSYRHRKRALLGRTDQRRDRARSRGIEAGSPGCEGVFGAGKCRWDRRRAKGRRVVHGGRRPMFHVVREPRRDRRTDSPPTVTLGWQNGRDQLFPNLAGGAATRTSDCAVDTTTILDSSVDAYHFADVKTCDNFFWIVTRAFRAWHHQFPTACYAPNISISPTPTVAVRGR